MFGGGDDWEGHKVDLCWRHAISSAYLLHGCSASETLVSCIVKVYVVFWICPSNLVQLQDYFDEKEIIRMPSFLQCSEHIERDDEVNKIVL